MLELGFDITRRGWAYGERKLRGIRVKRTGNSNRADVELGFWGRTSSVPREFPSPGTGMSPSLNVLHFCHDSPLLYSPLLYSQMSVYHPMLYSRMLCCPYVCSPFLYSSLFYCPVYPNLSLLTCWDFNLKNLI
ncbi:unnamed protein product [Meloidogyne enterolobii]|uniref:Uncharacterized protein n=1 Tax=Meloidogyne enterolobii TaxID=390850 RepID=A0ACB0YQ19_MELEN